MALLNSQTIFNLLITLIIGAALYYYIRYKFRVLELTQREQAKVLQRVIMSMNGHNGYTQGNVQNINDGMGGTCGRFDLSDINNDIERFKQVNSGELIDVSDEDESDSESEDNSSDSDRDSETDNDSESGSESDNDEEESQSTKKIIIGGNIESQTIEHLSGPDIKVIELSHPLFPSQNGNDEVEELEDDDEDEDEDEQDDDEDTNDEDSSDNGNVDNTNNIEEVTNTLTEVEHLENLENTEHNLTTLDENVNTEIDEISIKTIFKNKDTDTQAHQDLNGMNVQSLRQLYKQRLSDEGKNMSETAINKLTKKELIKNLQQ